MGYYSKDRPPPDRSEVPGVVAGLLDGVFTAATLPGGVRTQQRRKLKPGRPGGVAVTGRKPPWARIRVMLPESPTTFGQPMPERSEVVAVQVVAEVAGDPEQLAGWDYGRELHRIHRLAFETLNGETLELERATAVGPLRWGGYVNAAPVWDDRRRLWLWAAVYVVTLTTPASAA